MFGESLFKTLPLLLCVAMSTAVQADDTDDLLSSGELTFDSGDIEDQSPGLLDGFKTTLDHRHERVPADISREQSSVRIEYENAPAEGWFIRLDTRYRYFWRNDDLAEQRGERYGRNKWQRAWIQYSRGSCAYKVGRQRLIWGEVEGTFVNDVITPFDYTEQLLTDYGNVRLAQDMLVADCFMDNSQLQLFVTPEAKTTIFQHERLLLEVVPGQLSIDMTVDADEEWGMRYKWLGEGFDISLMYAKLYGNDPQVILNRGFVGAEIAHFDMYGAGASMAMGRLLLKAEIAYKDSQPVAFSTMLANRLDVAVGFEYTTRDNHFFNAGVWATHFDNRYSDPQDIQVLTVGWQKTYFNDDLAMSLLGNWASSPRFGSVTVLGEYQWTDYWNVSLALGVADVDDDIPFSSVLPRKKSATLGVKYEF